MAGRQGRQTAATDLSPLSDSSRAGERVAQLLRDLAFARALERALAVHGKQLAQVRLEGLEVGFELSLQLWIERVGDRAQRGRRSEAVVLLQPRHLRRIPGLEAEEAEQTEQRRRGQHGGGRRRRGGGGGEGGGGGAGGERPWRWRSRARLRNFALCVAAPLPSSVDGTAPAASEKALRSRSKR